MYSSKRRTCRGRQWCAWRQREACAERTEGTSLRALGNARALHAAAKALAALPLWHGVARLERRGRH